MKKWITLMSIGMLLSAKAQAQTTQPELHRFEFGEWTVQKESDDLDVYSKISVATQGFSFTLFNGDTIILGNTWPLCKWDTATYSVDGGKATHLLDHGRSAPDCDDIALNGRTIAAFKSGMSVRMRGPYGDEEFSLVGFSAALAKAKQLSKKER
jgi:hypothetical protein